MNDLRTAAQQALKALQTLKDRGVWGDFDGVADALKAALAEPDLFHCPKCGGPADNGHDRSIPPNPYFCTKCMAEPQACPHGVTDGNCKECYGEATNSEPFTVFTTLRQREWPALWTGCPNCASLEAQNTELDRKLAEMEAKLNNPSVDDAFRILAEANRRAIDYINELERQVNELKRKAEPVGKKRKPLSEAKIKKLLIEGAGMTVQFGDVDLLFARAIERAHGIKE